MRFAQGAMPSASSVTARRTAASRSAGSHQTRGAGDLIFGDSVTAGTMAPSLRSSAARREISRQHSNSAGRASASRALVMRIAGKKPSSGSETAFGFFPSSDGRAISSVRSMPSCPNPSRTCAPGVLSSGYFSPSSSVIRPQRVENARGAVRSPPSEAVSSFWAARFSMTESVFLALFQSASR